MKKIIISIICFISAFTLVIGAGAVDVSGRGAILIEADTGEVIYEKNSDAKLPMASTTKIMTALVAIENGNLSKKVKVSDKAVGVEGSSIYLKKGEVLTLEDLLYALMLQSANDAATAIAYEIAGGIDEFAVMMNDKASELGLSNTHFTNPHGLDNDAHYTSAHDLAIVTAYALKNETFAKIVGTYKHSIPLCGDEGTRVLVNHNRLLKSYDGAIGVKTGFTKKSGRCLVTAANRDGVNLIAVTLSDPDDWRDHTDLLDYGFSVFTTVQLAEVGSLIFDIPCTGGDAEFVQAVNKDELTIPIKTGNSIIRCRVETFSGNLLFAPVEKDTQIAVAIFTQDGAEIARLPLYASENVKQIQTKKGFFGLFK